MKTLLLAAMAMTAMSLPISVQAETAPEPSEKSAQALTPASAEKPAHPVKDRAKSRKKAAKKDKNKGEAKQSAQTDAPSGAADTAQANVSGVQTANGAQTAKVEAVAATAAADKDIAEKTTAEKSASRKESKKKATAKKDRPVAPHPDDYDALIAREARKHGVPESLVHRVVMRESRYEPTAFHRVYFGLMQITYATAHGMGYNGAPKGLLDAATNLAYAVPYLANAYLVADKDPDRAVQLYAGGYYYEAKRKHKLGELRTAKSEPVAPPVTQVAQTEVQAAPSNPVSRLFGALLGSPSQPQQQAAPQQTASQEAAPQQQPPQQAAAASQAQEAPAQPPQQTAAGEPPAQAAPEPVKAAEASVKERAEKPVKTASKERKDRKLNVKIAAKTPAKAESAESPATQTAAAK